MDTQITQNAKVFFAIIFILGFLSLGLSFYRYIVKQNFTVVWNNGEQ